MKKLILAAVILFTAEAFAHMFEPTHQIQGSLFTIARAEFLAGEHENRIVGGSLVIGANHVELIAHQRVYCPAGEMCIMSVPLPVHIRLPIVQREFTSCGDRYVALVDQRPMDGSLQKLEVIDYSRATCKRVIPALVEARYTVAFFDRVHGKPVERTTSLLLNR